jgi:hypothetical protein
MMLDRVERTGLGVALAGHVLLFAILSTGYFAMNAPRPLERRPIEVALVDEVGLESGAPKIATEAPAAKLAELEAPVEPLAPAPPEPADTAPAQPKATQSAAAAREPPAKQRPSATGGRLRGILRGIGERESDSESTAPPARTLTPEVQSALAAAVRRQLKPHWRAPTGADAELLRTELAISLAPNGAIKEIQVLRQTGITASNRAQAELHKERAIRAVRLAEPFQLPPQYYETWKLLTPIGFDKRLSQ